MESKSPPRTSNERSALGDISNGTSNGISNDRSARGGKSSASSPKRPALLLSPSPSALRHEATAKPLGPQCLLVLMPDEVLVEILVRLVVSDVCAFVRTCSQIVRCASNPRVWHTRSLRLVRASVPAWRGMAHHFAHIRSLTVEPCAHAAGPSLGLSAGPIMPRHSPFCPFGEPLPGQPQLTQCGGLTHSGLAILSGLLPRLVRLSVCQMGHLRYSSLLQILRDCPLLEHLDMSGCTAIAEPEATVTDRYAAEEPPRAHGCLTSLELSRTRASNATLEHLLPRLPALRKLGLNFCERLDSAPASEVSTTVGAILAGHASAHGCLREVELIGADCVKRTSVEQLREAGLALRTDETFIDAFLQQSPHRLATDLYALIGLYHSLP